MDIATILGTYFSLIGVFVALYQLRKTRKATEATQIAVNKTHQAITQNIFLSDISSVARTIEEIKLQIRTEKFESALLRVSDVITQLLQLSSLPQSIDNSRALNITQAVAQLSILREILEKELRHKNNEIKSVEINSVLSKISDRFNKVVGKSKFNIKAGENNA